MKEPNHVEWDKRDDECAVFEDWAAKHNDPLWECAKVLHYYDENHAEDEKFEASDRQDEFYEQACDMVSECEAWGCRGDPWRERVMDCFDGGSFEGWLVDERLRNAKFRAQVLGEMIP